MSEKAIVRCAWAGSDPAMVRYHDEEWGVVVTDGRALWEKLILDSFQAGLSWITILKRRDAFREAFAGFDPAALAAFGDTDIDRLLGDATIIRSRPKIVAAIGNARAYLSLGGADAFAELVWSLAGERCEGGDGIVFPAKTPVSEKIARALKSRGFTFVGPVIVYAWMQAVGMVNDHETACFRREACSSAAS